MEIILNEKEWIENAIEKHVLGPHPYIVIRRYAMYLRAQGRSNGEIRRTIEDYILRCNPNAVRYRWTKVIDKAIKESADRQLIEIDRIQITASEISAIKELRGVIRQKVMFTLLCVAKYRNAVLKKDDYWIGYDTKDIFRMANVSSSRKNAMLLLHDLLEVGYISHSKIVDSMSMRVNIGDDQSEPVVEVTDFRNLGYQYLRAIGRGRYMSCTACGAIVPQGSNSQKYCKSCAKRINLMKTLQRYHEKISDGVA